MKKLILPLLMSVLFINLTNTTIIASNTTNDSSENYPEKFRDYEQYINDPNYYSEENQLKINEKNPRS